jgi:PIN domain nuclease of toxin-antitoxin system
MSSLLLDTNALIFVFADRKAFGKKAKRTFDSAEAVYVSPISFFEIELKKRIGKMRGELTLESAQNAGLLELPYKHTDAVASARFPNLKTTDPFDLMLVAQAADNGMQFLTADQKLCESKLEFVIDLTK